MRPPGARRPSARDERDLRLLSLPPLLTLALILLHTLSLESRPLELLMIGAALLAALSRRVRERPITWLTLATLVGWSVARSWLWADNHKFLLLYWCLALACAYASDRPQRALARSARLLIGLCFAFAAAWKLITPDYLDGRAFHYLLLDDGRFAPLADWLGAGPSLRAHNAALRHALPDELAAVTLRDAPALRWVALALAWWTALLELAVAGLFLRPERYDRSSRREWIPPARDLALLLFISTTYALAPVPGFAWLLIAMGMSQSAPGPRGRAARLAYALALLLTQLYFVAYQLGA